MRVEFGWSFWLVAVAFSGVACKSRPEATPTVASASAPVSSASAAAPPPPKRNWPLPSGPALAVLPGQGVGSIRLGATVATIERHMALPCEVRTEELCRYIARGVDFHLEGGVTKTIHVQRAGRPAGKDKSGADAEFGFFNGALLPDLRLGMIPAALQEVLGPPKAKQANDSPGVVNNAEVHEYDGLRLEYDRIENGNLVLGGIWLLKSEVAPAAGGSAAAAPAKPPPK